jgi:hypothetical protein
MFLKQMKRKNANAINKNIRKRAVKKNISRLKPIKNTEEAFVVATVEKLLLLFKSG